MENQKQSVIDRLKQAKNVLVTVSKNPSIDQLSAAVATTLAINKMGIRANAVFSGKTPSVIEFLNPEETLEKNTDALRDFIISLDKAKADKLRYKVEDSHVKIFITPYKSSLSQEDLEFEQGEFNVDVVLALGVKEKNDLDGAITAHGRILHDATVIDISTDANAQLGTLIWTNPKASSLCEMTLSLVSAIKSDILDEQIATAYLTGIVAETERFSNQKTTSEVMQASGQLMTAGANQQLVASKLQPATELPDLPEIPPEIEDVAHKSQYEDNTLENIEKSVDSPHLNEEPAQKTEPTMPKKPKNEDGALEIAHDEDEKEQDNPSNKADENKSEETTSSQETIAQIHIDDNGNFYPDGRPRETNVQPPSQSENRGMALTPPTMGGQLTANSHVEQTPPNVDGTNAQQNPMPLLNRDKPAMRTDDEQDNPQTLENLEQAVDSPHLTGEPTAPVIPSMPEEPTPPPAQPDPNAPPAVPPPMMPPVEPPPEDSDASL